VSIGFTWDPLKNSENVKKHHISFDEAKSVFYDDNARVVHDPDHSNDEDRFIIIGLSITLRILIVSHRYRERENVIRIISARKANNRERKQYTEFLS
jgi:uncharacterized protein